MAELLRTKLPHDGSESVQPRVAADLKLPSPGSAAQSRRSSSQAIGGAEQRGRRQSSSWQRWQVTALSPLVPPSADAPASRGATPMPPPLAAVSGTMVFNSPAGRIAVA